MHSSWTLKYRWEAPPLFMPASKADDVTESGKKIKMTTLFDLKRWRMDMQFLI
jgi:hypothetical protein